MSLRPNTPRAGLLSICLLLPLFACASGGGESEPDARPAPAGEGAAATPNSAAAPNPAPASEGAYTTDQAEEGERLYRDLCGECHFTREFRGTDFFFNWEGTSVGGFLDLIVETMPEDDPGSLAMDQYLAVTAYILQMNDYPAGAGPLTTESAAGMTFERVNGAAPVGATR
jgi:mono/diheme cytochrome c family protein